MGLLTSTSSLALWQQVVKTAEEQCAISLKQELESYLVTLLIRYSNKPEVAQRILATAYLEAMQLKHHARDVSLQYVADECLLYAGLFPRLAEKRQVTPTYFIDLGRSAYAAISHHTNDLFAHLANQFILLMDILRSIRSPIDLHPWETYMQWSELGSPHAANTLEKYTNILPFKPR